MTSSCLRFGATVAALSTFLALAACSREVEDFAFNAPDGRQGLRSSASLPKGSQGGLLSNRKNQTGTPPAGRSETALFTLTDPLRVGPSDVFALTYRGQGGPFQLHLLERDVASDAKREVSVMLPSIEALPGSAGSPGSRVTYLVPFKAERRIEGFRVSAEGFDSQFRIVGAGVREDYPGVEFQTEGVLIRDGVSTIGAVSADGSNRRLTVGFGALVDGLGADQAKIEILYRWTGQEASSAVPSATGPSGEESGRVVITASNRNDVVRYRVRTRPGEHRLYLYTASCGFTPRQLRFEYSDPSFEIRAIQVRRFAAAPAEAAAGRGGGGEAPIPADFGTIISYRAQWWRQKGYEIFSWSLIPSVLVIDFRSLEVQSRFMTRLAFFVEKLGYVGRLWSNEALAGRHGWNAHDYRPEDLARFYTVALQEGFTLNPEEIALRTILLSSGLIVEQREAYRPGKGAVITVAHTGSYSLKHILLTHEGYHGIFFTHPEYQNRVFEIWDEADPHQKEIFRRFLRSKGYDVGNPYLVVNEFQAYLMQQPLAEVDPYFRWRLRPAVLHDGGETSSELSAYFRDHPHLFAGSARSIQDALRSTAGLDAGGLVSLELLDR